MGVPHTKQMTISSPFNGFCLHAGGERNVRIMHTLFAVYATYLPNRICCLCFGGCMIPTTSTRTQQKIIEQDYMYQDVGWFLFGQYGGIFSKNNGDPATTFPTILCGSWWLRDQNSLTKTILGDIKQCYARKICPDWNGWNHRYPIRRLFISQIGSFPPLNPWQPLGPLLKVKRLVGPTCKIPRSTQRGCSGIRRSSKMCQVGVTYCWWFRNPIPNHLLDVSSTLWILGYRTYINWWKRRKPYVKDAF